MIVDGANVVKELLNSNARIDKVIVEKSTNKEVLQIMDIANRKGVPIQIMEKKDLERVAKTKTQGVVAFIPNFEYSDVRDVMLEAERKGEKPFIVILDGIEDPHNLGAIVRTCECAGVHGVIIPENRACEVNATVYRTSAGAVANMRICRVVNLTRTIDELKQQGVWVYAMEAGNKRIYDADFTYPTAIVVGSEGKGVSRLVREHSDETLSLDMFGKVNSLNASNATAIAVYEVVRQRRI